MNVIFVDDSKAILDRYAKYVKNINDIDAASFFTNRKAAIQYIESNNVDIAFLDIRLIDDNDKDGFELAKDINKISPHTHIIMTTNFAMYEEALSKDVHASGYLRKPVKQVDIEDEIKKISVQKRGSSSEVEARMFGNFTLYKDGKPIPFKRMPTYEILAYLIAKNGTEVNAKEISYNIFEREDYQANFISNYIKDLYNELKRHNIEHIINKKTASSKSVYYSINTSAIKCDYYEFIKGTEQGRNAYVGEFCTGFGSWTMQYENNIDKILGI